MVAYAGGRPVGLFGGLRAVLVLAQTKEVRDARF